MSEAYGVGDRGFNARPITGIKTIAVLIAFIESRFVRFMETLFASDQGETIFGFVANYSYFLGFMTWVLSIAVSVSDYVHLQLHNKFGLCAFGQLNAQVREIAWLSTLDNSR